MEFMYLRKETGRKWRGPAEVQAAKSEFHVQREYLEVATSFGFATLFVSVAPCVPMLVSIGALIEQQVDKYRLLQCCQRPMPESRENVGHWTR